MFDHTDIYKGRIASLVADLLYDQEARRTFPGAESGLADSGVRCGAAEPR